MADVLNCKISSAREPDEAFSIRFEMKRISNLSAVLAGTVLLCVYGCGGGGEEAGDGNIISATITLTDASGSQVAAIPAAGSPAGVVTGRITLKPGLDVNPATVKMTVVRDDFVAIGGSPVVMDHNLTSGEYSAAIAIPDNAASYLRTYKVSVTARNSAGRPVPFISQIGTFKQSEP